MVKVIVPPASEPVSLDDFKAWMQGIPVPEDQAVRVNGLLKAGREEAEAYQNAAYCEQTLQFVPEIDGGSIPPAIALPRPPFRELKSVACYDPDDTPQDVTDLFETDNLSSPATLRPKNGVALPGPLRSTNPLVITYTAGYDADKIPERVKQAILLYATWAWMHRGGDQSIPPAFYALLSKGRVIPV
jgi:uncharacterized phiE125 gp8 family phage protein